MAVLEKGIVYNYQLNIVEKITGESITVNNKLNICREKVRPPKKNTSKPPINNKKAPWFRRTSARNIHRKRSSRI